MCRVWCSMVLSFKGSSGSCLSCVWLHGSVFLVVHCVCLVRDSVGLSCFGFSGSVFQGVQWVLCGVPWVCLPWGSVGMSCLRFSKYVLFGVERFCLV